MEAAEALQVGQGHAGVTGQMQQGIKQQRALSRRQHEAVPIRPMRIGGVEFEKSGPQYAGDVRHLERNVRAREVPGARAGCLDGIDREHAQSVRHAAFAGIGFCNCDLRRNVRRLLRYLGQESHSRAIEGCLAPRQEWPGC